MRQGQSRAKHVRNLTIETLDLIYWQVPLIEFDNLHARNSRKFTLIHPYIALSSRESERLAKWSGRELLRLINRAKLVCVTYVIDISTRN